MHKNKKILITGATSGLGLLLTQLCIEKGYQVHATGRNEERLNSLKEMGAFIYKADLNQLHDIESICKLLPPMDVAIINAGIGLFENAIDLTNDQIDEMLQVNVRAPIILCKLLVKEMIHQKQGHIILIGSQAGKVATKKSSVYAATKHAITGFANGLRMEVAEHNIKVTAVYPGPIDTPFLQKADPTDTYRQSIKPFLLDPVKVANNIMQSIEKPKREMNLPRVMSITSKLYAVAPTLVEKLGQGFFNKK